MHGNVSIAENIARSFMFHIAGGDPDIDINRNGLSAEGKRLSNILINASRDFLRFINCSYIAEHDGKFIPPDASHNIITVEHSDKAFGSDNKHLIADSMPERVINILKFSDINK